MLFSFFFALLASSAVFAEVTGRRVDRGVKACTRELEGIVYTPANCGFDYLKRITETLRIQSPTFWNNPLQAKAAFESFAQTYGVTVVAITPFGNVLDYIGSPDVVEAGSMGAAIARANLDGNGFVYNSATQRYIYATIFRGPDGQMYYVRVSMLKADAPIAC